MPSMISALKEFAGLPHRCQWVAESGGVSWYNDSKGTNTGACIAAINGLAGKGHIILLAGGQGKGADFRSLRDAVSRHCRLLVTLGEAAQDLAAALGDAVEVRAADSLQQAVEIARETARAGDLVLLSPACASFDMFSSYIERGERFTALVQAFAGVGDE